MKRFAFSVFSISALLLPMLLAAENYREINVQNGASIRGVVKVDGQPPAATTIAVSSDAAACGKTKSLASMVIGPNKGLKNTVVWLADILQGKKMPAQINFELDQEKCEYQPHIIIVPLKATLNILNSDAVMHNVHAYEISTTAGNNSAPPTLFNIAIPVKGMKIGKAMEKPGMYRLLCDAGHPWMNAYVLVTEHPYFAVTDENGRYTIDNVPPGTYTVTVWHEGSASVEPATKAYKAGEAYKDSRKMTVSAGSAAEADFVFKLKQERLSGTEAKLGSH